MIRPRGPRHRQALAPGRLPPHLGPHLHPLLGVDPLDPLGVHPPALPPQQDSQTAVTKPHMDRGQLFQPLPQGLLRPAARFVSRVPLGSFSSLAARGSLTCQVCSTQRASSLRARGFMGFLTRSPAGSAGPDRDQPPIASSGCFPRATGKAPATRSGSARRIVYARCKTSPHSRPSGGTPPPLSPLPRSAAGPRWSPPQSTAFTPSPKLPSFLPERRYSQRILSFTWASFRVFSRHANHFEETMWHSILIHWNPKHNGRKSRNSGARMDQHAVAPLRSREARRTPRILPHQSRNPNQTHSGGRQTKGSPRS